MKLIIYLIYKHSNITEILLRKPLAENKKHKHIFTECKLKRKIQICELMKCSLKKGAVKLDRIYIVF